MERVQSTILLHGVAYVQRSIAPDTKKTCIKKEQLYVSSKEHSVEKKDKYMRINVNNNLLLL